MMSVYYEMINKIRFSESNDGLYLYLKDRKYNFSHLAKKVGMSHSGLMKMLKGRTNRYDEEKLEGLADQVGLLFNRDENGVFFYDPGDEGKVIADLDRDLQRFISMWEDLTPSQKRKYLRLIEIID